MFTSDPTAKTTIAAGAATSGPQVSIDRALDFEQHVQHLDAVPDLLRRRPTVLISSIALASLATLTTTAFVQPTTSEPA